MIRRFLVIAGILLLPAYATAQAEERSDETCADELELGPAALDGELLCEARITAFERDLAAYAADLCKGNTRVGAGQELRREAASLWGDCNQDLRARINASPRSALARFVHQVPRLRDAVPQEIIQQDREFWAAFDKIVHYRTEVSKGRGARWERGEAERRFDDYVDNSGLAANDPRHEFLRTLLHDDKPVAEDVFKKVLPLLPGADADLLAALCDKAKDEALEKVVRAAVVQTLATRGPSLKELEKLKPLVAAAKSGLKDPSAFDDVIKDLGDLTRPAVKRHIERHYGDLGSVSSNIVKLSSNELLHDLGQDLGLKGPELERGSSWSHEPLAAAGRKFDAQGNLRIVFANHCELQGVHNVTGGGETGALLADEGWEGSTYEDDFTGVLSAATRHGIYDQHSYKHDKDIPVSELVLREPRGTDTSSYRQYDVDVKCNGQTRVVRVTIPPIPHSERDADFVCESDAPPYDKMMEDGMLYGFMVAGSDQIDIGEIHKILTREMGFQETNPRKYRNDDVDYAETFFKHITDQLDMLHVKAHANGYQFNTGLFRANKRAATRMYKQTLPNGKPYYLRVLAPKPGEGKESKSGVTTIGYADYLEKLRNRENNLIVWRGSCSSEGKCQYMHSHIRNSNVTFIPTTTLTSTYRGYWKSGWWIREWNSDKHKYDWTWSKEGDEGAKFYQFAADDPSFAPVHGVSNLWNYERMGEFSTDLKDDYYLPSEPGYCETMKRGVQRQWANQDLGTEIKTIKVDPKPEPRGTGGQHGIPGGDDGFFRLITQEIQRVPRAHFEHIYQEPAPANVLPLYRGGGGHGGGNNAIRRD